MYLDHFGLSEPPFRITPHTDFFFAGGNRGATLDALIYAVTHDEGIVKISGEVGSGKTMLCRVLIERLPPHVAIVYLANPSLSRADILYAIADELNLALPEQARPSVVLRALQDHLIRLYGEGRRVVVLIDEAHAMPVETLEEIRLLSNLESGHSKLLQLVLFGQPELDDVLARADMRQLKERITHNFLLEPLVRDDVAAYLEFRMRTAGYRGPNVFSPSATRLISEASLGLTRRINMLADKALLAAFSENVHQISTKQVRAAIKDCDFSQATRVRKPVSPRLGIIAAGILILAIAGITWFRTGNPPAPASPAVSSTGSPVVSSPVLPTGSPKPATQPLAVTAPEPISTAATAAPQPPPSSPAMPAPAPAAKTLAALPVENPMDKAIRAGKSWLANTSDSLWFLQLYAVDANQRGRIESFLQEMETAGSDMSKVRVYVSDLSGKLRYGVIYGDYASARTAANDIRNLAPLVREKHPYPRQVIRLK
jgi:MSHA biogenesis protein MshM